MEPWPVPLWCGGCGGAWLAGWLGADGGGVLGGEAERPEADGLDAEGDDGRGDEVGAGDGGGFDEGGGAGRSGVGEGAGRRRTQPGRIRSGSVRARPSGWGRPWLRWKMSRQRSPSSR